MFDKKTGKTHQPAIVNVANEAGFYDDVVEAELAKNVESPANPVIEKLRTGQSIDPKERHALSSYIAVMLKRVPFRRQKGLEMFPAVRDKTISEIRAWMHSGRDDPSVDQDVLGKRLAQMDALEEKYKDEVPDNIIEQIRTPWPSQQMIDLIYAMTWSVVETSGPSFFLTSDNPAFFFGAYGFGSEESEMTFPLSSQRAVHGCWQGAREALYFLQGEQSLVKEINRRVASTTSRFAFYHAPENWIHQLLQRADPLLSRINWGDRGHTPISPARTKMSHSRQFATLHPLSQARRPVARRHPLLATPPNRATRAPQAVPHAPPLNSTGNPPQSPPTAPAADSGKRKPAR